MNRSISDLLEAVRGRERSILTDHFGFSLPAKAKRGAPCPCCGGVDRFSWFVGRDGKWRVHCRRCDLRGDLVDAMVFLGVVSDFSEAREVLDDIA